MKNVKTNNLILFIIILITLSAGQDTSSYQPLSEVYKHKDTLGTNNYSILKMLNINVNWELLNVLAEGKVSREYLFRLGTGLYHGTPFLSNRFFLGGPISFSFMKDKDYTAIGLLPPSLILIGGLVYIVNMNLKSIIIPFTLLEIMNGEIGYAVMPKYVFLSFGQKSDVYFGEYPIFYYENNINIIFNLQPVNIKWSICKPWSKTYSGNNNPYLSLAIGVGAVSQTNNNK
jgi:hypothetical protein